MYPAGLLIPGKLARRDRRSALPIEPERQNKSKMFK
jgi:hypothetical protein